MFVDDYARTQVWETRAAEVSRVPGAARSLPRTDRPSQLHAKGSSLATALRPGGPGPCFQEFLRADNGFHVGLLCLEPASQNKCACQNIGGSNRPRAHHAQSARARGRPDPATDKGPGQGGRCASLSHLAGGDKAARRAPRGAGRSKRGHPWRGTQGWGPLSGFPQLVS